MGELTNRLAINARLFRVMGLVIVMALFSGCASSTPPAPTEALTDASDAIASAEQSGARRYAGSELDEAKQKLVQAQESVSNEKMVEAERFAREAVIAAELATARTESAKAKAINREMGRGADALDEEMRRSGDQQ